MPTQAFSCEFCQIFKNTFFYRTPPVTVSVCNLITLSYFPAVSLLTRLAQLAVFANLQIILGVR